MGKGWFGMLGWLEGMSKGLQVGDCLGLVFTVLERSVKD